MTRLRKTCCMLGAVLCVFTLARLLLFTVYFGVFSRLSFGETLRAFLGGLRYDLSIILTILGPPLVMVNLPFRFAESPRWQAAWAWVVYAGAVLFSFVLVGDVIYFDYVKRHLADELLMVSSDLDAPAGLMLSTYLLHTLAFTCFVVAVFVLWRRLVKVPVTPSRHPWLKAAVVLGLVVLGARGTVSGQPLDIADSYSSHDSAGSNLTLNGAFTLYHSIAEDYGEVSHQHFSSAEAARLVGLDAPAWPEGDLPDGCLIAGRKPANVVIVMVESWGSMYVDSFGGNGFDVTPNFDRLAGQGLVFPNFYAAGQRSIPGTQAVLTGVPVMIGSPMIAFTRGATGYPNTGEILRRHGFSTIFVQSGKRSSFKLDLIAEELGFEQYYGMEDAPRLLKYPHKAPQYGWDYETLMLLKGKLDAAKKPFVAYLVTGTTHVPFASAGKQFEKYRPHTSGGESGYLNTLYYSDWSIGQFMKEAAESPWFNDTVFIFTADHVSATFRQHGFVEGFNVPLLIYAPGIFRPGRIETVGSQVDLMPTVLQVLGVPERLPGPARSLFSKTDCYACVCDQQTIGLVTRQGYVRRSPVGRLEAMPIGAPMSRDYFDGLERKLLAFDQVVDEMITRADSKH